MERQEYPKILYRNPAEPLETLLVNSEQENEAAKLEGWGEHPSTLPPKIPTVVDLNRSAMPGPFVRKVK